MSSPFLALLVVCVNVCLFMSLAALTVILVVMRKDRNDTSAAQEILKEYLERVDEREKKWRKWLTESLHFDEASQKKKLMQLIELESACAKARVMLYLNHDKQHFDTADEAFNIFVAEIQQTTHIDGDEGTKPTENADENKTEAMADATPSADTETFAQDRNAEAHQADHESEKAKETSTETTDLHPENRVANADHDDEKHDEAELDAALEAIVAGAEEKEKPATDAHAQGS